MMVNFMLAAAGLTLAALLCLLRPWRRLATNDPNAARDINTRIYRDQLQELDRDLSNGTLAPADHAQARAEVHRQLLDDANTNEAPASHDRSMRKTALVLVLALPLSAAALYVWRGEPAALEPRARQGATQRDVEQMVASLAARLDKNPDDANGWAVLARSYRAMGRLPEAQKAFTRIGPLLNRDPVLLSEYADLLGTLANGNLEGQPLELVARALALDPDNRVALSLAGMAAFNRGDTAHATQHWTRLLALLPPESDNAKWLVQTLADMRRNASTPSATPAPDKGLSISGSVNLSPALADKVGPTDTVFVFARSVQGPRMPLAVQRARVAELPVTFQLDDSMAVSPEFKLSSVSEVRIEARISRSGSATPASGDLIGQGPVVKLGSTRVSVQIDQVRP